jgi:EAL domain-containing protein (putative c-di-GMP-specific phosphodiesterase class I)
LKRIDRSKSYRLERLLKDLKGSEEMKIIAVNGSPRKGGNTDLLLDEVLGIIKRNQIETETIFLED